MGAGWLLYKSPRTRRASHLHADLPAPKVDVAPNHNGFDLRCTTFLLDCVEQTTKLKVAELRSLNPEYSVFPSMIPPLVIQE